MNHRLPSLEILKSRPIQFVANPSTPPSDDEKAFLSKIGLPLELYSNTVTVTESQLDDLATLAQSGIVTTKSRVINMFSDAVVFFDCRTDGCETSAESMNPEQIYSKIGSLRAEHFGCKDRIKTSDGLRTGARFKFKLINDTQDYVFEVWGKKYVDDGISMVRLRRENNADSVYQCSKF